jgi:rhodanese-related sulfurtransferase
LEFIRNNLLYVVLAVTSGGMLLWQTLRGTGGNQVTPQEATLLINREDALVVDVRDSAEWAAGHIVQAHHIALDQLDRRLTEIEKYKQRTVIVCCLAGGRSSGACARLKAAGFEKVFNLSGGINAWREAGLPLTTHTTR